MDQLVNVVRREVEKYAVRSINSKIYKAFDDNTQVYIVMSVAKEQILTRAIPLVMACIVHNQVVIESDTTNKPLVDALVQVGIPRDKIVLAYEGETIPQEIVSKESVS